MDEKLINIGITNRRTREYLLDFMYKPIENNIFSDQTINLNISSYIDRLTNQYRLPNLIVSILNITDNIEGDIDNLEDVKIPLTEDQISKLKHTEYDKDIYGDSKCGICQSEIDGNEKIIELPCKHIFHTECIMPWIREYHHICPICKIDIRDNI